MAKMPVQKPGKSEQVVCTPVVLLDATKLRLNIHQFDWNLVDMRFGIGGRKNEQS